jgi:hypothetical protein
MEHAIGSANEASLREKRNVRLVFERFPSNEYPNSEVAYVEFVTTGVSEHDFRISIPLAGLHISSNCGLRCVSRVTDAGGERPDDGGERDGDGDDEDDADDRRDCTA